MLVSFGAQPILAGREKARPDAVQARSEIVFTGPGGRIARAPLME